MSFLDNLSEKDKLILEEEKLASMNEMMQNIAHQWRQPLSQINSTVGIIDDILYKKNIQDPLLEEKLKEIETLTKYMSNTINDFQGYFKKNNEKASFYLGDTIEKSVDIIRGVFKENKIVITTNIDKNLECNGYDNELQQVIVILLNNAKDALLNRNVHIARVEINVFELEGKYVVEVCDNAGGMTKNLMKKVFEPYFTTKHKSQGTGLGLYMSKKMIEERFNGSLSVRNAHDGVCFRITLAP
jgi:signal transduction histidine kinase